MSLVLHNRLNRMAYERKKDAGKPETNYNYVIVDEDDEDRDSDSSDVFLNGPKKRKQGFTTFSPRIQVTLCIVFTLALILFVFVIYNFLAFIIAFQSALQKFQQQIPLICQTAHHLNSKMVHGLAFCKNVTFQGPITMQANYST